jgi:hypothetical protein
MSAREFGHRRPGVYGHRVHSEKNTFLPKHYNNTSPAHLHGHHVGPVNDQHLNASQEVRGSVTLATCGLGILGPGSCRLGSWGVTTCSMFVTHADVTDWPANPA